MDDPEKTARIRALNDAFRTSMMGGKFMITPGIDAFGRDGRNAILRKVRDYTNFTPENDPYKEHEFGVIEHQKTTIYWKIDYYDPDLEYGSDDPSDPEKTVRVLTVMLASEY